MICWLEFYTFAITTRLIRKIKDKILNFNICRNEKSGKYKYSSRLTFYLIDYAEQLCPKLSERKLLDCSYFTYFISRLDCNSMLQHSLISIINFWIVKLKESLQKRAFEIRMKNRIFNIKLYHFNKLLN